MSQVNKPVADKKSNQIYPFPCDIKKISLENYNSGNFGLWFNKFIPWSEELKPCNSKGEKDKSVEYYKEFYDKNKHSHIIKELLEKKHVNQCNFYKSFKAKYEVIIVSAELISPLITGIGQTHPNEVGMTFDHIIGIPYIPASTVKGVVRFSYILGLLQNNPDNFRRIANKNGYFDEEKETDVPILFGMGGNKDNEGKIGKVIFLDAYPEVIPELSVDIMNPHYGGYYSDKEPPADYLSPKPIKFLTVAKGTKFIFRILINKTHDELKYKQELKDLVSNAVKKSLEEDGVGAKTAVGYGLFKIDCYDEPKYIKDLIGKQEADKAEKMRQLEEQKKIKEIENMSEVDKICYKLKCQYMENYSMEIFNKIDTYEEDDKIKIAQSLKLAWIDHGKWNEKEASPKQKEKIKKIKSILKE